VIIGISVGGSAPAQLGLVQAKELQIRGIIGSPGVWPETIRFISRTGIDLSKLVTATFDISEADKAYQTVLNDKSQIKVHVTSKAN
jgi:L-iditol 2-dehydrogenase